MILAKHYTQFDGLASVRGTPHRRVQRLHYQYLQAQRAEVEAVHKQLTELKNSPRGPDID